MNKKTPLRVWPGKPYPLGATWDGGGVNFALFSENAAAVELCLFDSSGASKESHRIKITEQTDNTWHIFLPDIKPGQLYGYRVHGPYEPEAGHRFNPNKIVLDPYAKAIGRQIEWGDELFGYCIGHEKADLSFDDRDNAALAPLAAVSDPTFDWGDDQAPKIPWHKTLIYETHVKGFTKLHPGVPDKKRGTFAGLASDAAIKHLKDLGVTAVELMPVHHHADDRHLLDRKLTNYWGYNTLSYFAADRRYASADDPLEGIREFKQMVRSLHAAGIEVILDVVYNHTAEGNHLGPTLSLRGVDNAAYYRLVPETPRYHMDFTGCGNTLNMRHPRVIQLIMDSLRYWVTEMRVDGFRFDLASALARELYEVDKLSAFFDVIHQDPILSQVKLIAEPWDVGDGGYQVGNFPVGWTEWNGRYRDDTRRFWKGDGGLLSEFATRLSGSSDLYQESGRSPFASINFITSHDGYSLQDLVSYNEKHNEANGEGGNDGDNNNLSWNCGAEGETRDAEILALREKQKRNFIATLLFSQGVAMIRGGDEMSQSQGGNNNTYCHDNELTWLNWDLTPSQRSFFEFVCKAVAIWRNQPVLRRRKFFLGRRIRGSEIKDITWIAPSGHEMKDEQWDEPHARCLAFCLDGRAINHVNERGEHIVGDTLLFLLNAHYEPVPFTLPEVFQNGTAHTWELLLDTARPDAAADHHPGRTVYSLDSRSLSLFRLASA